MTTADAHDNAGRLVEALDAYSTCKAKHDGLANAVRSREAAVKSAVGKK